MTDRPTAESPARRLLAATKATRAEVRHRPLHRLLLCGELGPSAYSQLLWAHRQLLSAAEDSVWGARAGLVAGVRQSARRRTSLLERDLVDTCDKRLEVYAPLNRLLESWTEQARRTTDPGTLLGRLFVLEGLPVDYARVPADTLRARSGAPAVHYFAPPLGEDRCFEDFRRFCGALDAALADDAARHAAAVRGALDLYGAIDRAYVLIGQLTLTTTTPRRDSQRVRIGAAEVGSAGAGERDPQSAAG